LHWLRLYTEITRDRKLRRHPPSVRWCWIAILVIARQSPQPGKLLLGSDVTVTIGDIADEASLDVTETSQAVTVFQELGMLSEENGVYIVNNFNKRQPLTDTAGAERTRKWRELKKKKSVTSPKRHGDALELELELDKDIDILNYLNSVCGTHFKMTNKHKTIIRARIKEKYSLSDFKTVIDKKHTEWKGTEQEKYLRPETLFGTKFDGYLNQPIKIGKIQTGIDQLKKLARGESDEQTGDSEAIDIDGYSTS